MNAVIYAAGSGFQERVDAILNSGAECIVMMAIHDDNLPDHATRRHGWEVAATHTPTQPDHAAATTLADGYRAMRNGRHPDTRSAAGVGAMAGGVLGDWSTSIFAKRYIIAEPDKAGWPTARRQRRRQRWR